MFAAKPIARRITLAPLPRMLAAAAAAPNGPITPTGRNFRETSPGGTLAPIRLAASYPTATPRKSCSPEAPADSAAARAAGMT